MERTEVLQQKLEHWCAASVRALANEPSLHFRGHALSLKGQHFAMQAPHLHLDFASQDTRKLRGVADAIALRLIHSDNALHQSLLPKDVFEALTFNLLEQLRCESQCPNTWPGTAVNLRARFLFWAGQTATSELTENNIGLLFYSLAVVCWSRLLGQAIPEQIEDIIEHTRWGFADSIGKHLRELKANRQDQLAFSQPALAIATIISDMIGDASQNDDQSEASSTLKLLAKPNKFSSQWLDNDNSLAQLSLGTSRADELAFEAQGFEYRIYTNAYDTLIHAGKSIRAAQLKKLRAQLDKRIRQQSVNTHRVARYLKQHIASPALLGWSFGEEEGYLDSARLARIVTSPDDRRLFRKEQTRPASDCVISILIDNSGSMTHHNEKIAALVDTLAKAMEMAEISVEVLGFTTGDWNGGKVAKEWVAAAKPDHPGRLNSLCHIVYKAASTPWRRSRAAIAGMLKSDLFREGIDGEALQWAVSRIERRPEAQKIVLMISDGSPMDTATHTANSDRYLDRHLAHVAIEIENRPDIKLCALGVGLDLSTYFQQSLSISIEQELSTNDVLGIAKLIKDAI